MNELHQHIARVQEKLQALLKKHQQVLKENIRLRSDLQKLQEVHTKQEKQVTELRQQLHVVKLNASGMSEPEKKELEKQINNYLKEIDKCIAMLSA
jgi:hypothetical protein